MSQTIPTHTRNILSYFVWYVDCFLLNIHFFFRAMCGDDVFDALLLLTTSTLKSQNPHVIKNGHEKKTLEHFKRMETKQQQQTSYQQKWLAAAANVQRVCILLIVLCLVVIRCHLNTLAYTQCVSFPRALSLYLSVPLDVRVFAFMFIVYVNENKLFCRYCCCCAIQYYKYTTDVTFVTE